jgi:O-antigen/teichoic acid export membrane protein
MSIEAVGVLEMAYKFAPMLNLFVMLPFMRAWQTKSMEIAPRPEAPAQMADVFVKFLFAMLVVAVFMAACIRDVIALLTPPSFWQAIPIARIEIATTVIAGGSAFMTFGLLYGGKSASLSRIKMWISVLKVILCFALISYLGLAGAAFSALVAESITFAWLYRWGQREYFVPVDWRRVAALCVLALASAALATMMSRPGGYATGLASDVIVGPLISAIGDLVRSLVGARAGDIIANRQATLSGLLVSAFLACSFLLAAPLAHQDWQRRLSTLVRSGFTRSRET